MRVNAPRFIQDTERQQRQDAANAGKNDCGFCGNFRPFKLFLFVGAPLSILGLIVGFKMFDRCGELARKGLNRVADRFEWYGWIFCFAVPAGFFIFEVLCLACHVVFLSVAVGSLAVLVKPPFANIHFPARYKWSVPPVAKESLILSSKYVSIRQQAYDYNSPFELLDVFPQFQKDLEQHLKPDGLADCNYRKIRRRVGPTFPMVPIVWIVRQPTRAAKNRYLDTIDDGGSLAEITQPKRGDQYSLLRNSFGSPHPNNSVNGEYAGCVAVGIGPYHSRSLNKQIGPFRLRGLGGVSRDLRLLSDGAPLQSGEDRIGDSDRNQEPLDQHRWRVPVFVLGVGLFFSGFGLLLYSAKRFTQSSFRRLQRRYWDLGLLILSALVLFCGGCFMLIWPRLL
jgi:hypothetical protein